VAIERIAGGASLIDVLDRVLDKGIVIDTWVRVSLVGIDLLTDEAKAVVASVDTYSDQAKPKSLKRRNNRSDSDEDDGDGGGGEGSSGAPAMVSRPLQPRNVTPSRPPRTRQH
jgi:gas vesicle structural protein